MTEKITPDTVHQLLCALWLQRWEDDWNPNPDPTLCFLAIYLMKDDGVFLEPHLVTPPLTRLSRAIRLTVLREIHRTVSAGEKATLSSAFDALKDFVYDGSGFTTLQTLRYHNRFATTLAHKTMGLPRIVWPRHHVKDYSTLMYDGRTVSIPLLRACYERLENQAIKIWETDVLLGVREHVPRGMPGDAFTNTSRGYSFLQDGDFLHYRKLLGRRFLQDPTLLGRFATQDPVTDVLSFNASACQTWLHKLAQLEAILMILIEMRSGGPIRLAELAATLAVNVETRSRNLYAYGPQILIVCQYNKTTNNHQSDTIAPHALAAFESDMLIQVHTLARPFAEVSLQSIPPLPTRLLMCANSFSPSSFTQTTTFSIVSTEKCFSWTTSGLPIRPQSVSLWETSLGRT